MKFVIDSNILFAALMKDSTTKELIILLDVELYFPDSLMKEIFKYKDLIKKKAGFSEQEFHENLKTLLEYIILVPEEELKKFLNQALEEMKFIDPKDSPVLACALAHEGSVIWAQDEHLHKQKLVQAVRTKEVIDIYLKGKIQF
ncbi:MAG: PIN domain-containing protein [Candidatus Micrarchaeota archaeon]